MTRVDKINGYWIVELTHREQIAHGYIYGIQDAAGRMEYGAGGQTIDETLQAAANMNKGDVTHGYRD